MEITRRHFFFGSMALPAFAAKAPPPRPNVLLFLVDNLPAWMLSCYGQQRGPRAEYRSVVAIGHAFSQPLRLHARTASEPRHFSYRRDPHQAASPDTGLDKILGGLGYEVHSGEAADVAAFLGEARPQANRSSLLPAIPNCAPPTTAWRRSIATSIAM